MIDTPIHPAVRHRDAFIHTAESWIRRASPAWMGRVNDWAVEHLEIALGSSAGVWLAFVIPLLAFKIPVLLSILGLISSYWIQLWALFVLQKASNKADVKSKAQADANHEAQTHVAIVGDDTNVLVHAIAEKLDISVVAK
jgi:hypothetical protein